MSTTEAPELTGSNTEGKHLGLALAVIAGAQLMIVLDATIVNVALPTIHHDLHFSVNNLEWLITAYSLTFGGLLLFGGRTGDLFGKRRMFMIGIAIFAVSSLLGGFATTDVWLIITRACQGVGGAIAAPTALSLIATNFPEGPERNRAMGVYASMAGAGGAVGLLLGGILVDLVSWRWIFFVNVPIAAFILFLTPRALNESSTTSGKLDVPGALSATGGMLALVYGLSNVAGHSWTATSTLISLFVAAVLLIAFVLDRDAHDRGVDAAAHLREPQPLRRLRDDALHRHRDVLDVLLPHAVPAERAGLECHSHRRGILAHDAGHHRGRGTGLEDDQQDRHPDPAARRSGRRSRRSRALDATHDPQWLRIHRRTAPHRLTRHGASPSCP